MLDPFMVAAHIYQIFYDADTRARLDPGFTPLDNVDNARPDWREYWPMRQFLLSQSLVEEDHYGFLSPKFHAKTGLTATQVERFIAAHAQADVVLFSPFVDQSAPFFNMYEQGNYWHPGLLSCAQSVLGETPLQVNLEALVNHSGNVAFCNYFVAKPRFWRRWLELNERLYAIAEAGAGSLAASLNAITLHDGRADAPMKVFIMERSATLLLSTGAEFSAVAYDPFRLPYIDPRKEALKNVLLVCDALKTAHALRGSVDYKQEFFDYRKQWLRKLRLHKRASALLAFS